MPCLKSSTKVKMLPLRIQKAFVQFNIIISIQRIKSVPTYPLPRKGMVHFCIVIKFSVHYTSDLHMFGYERRRCATYHTQIYTYKLRIIYESSQSYDLLCSPRTCLAVHNEHLRITYELRYTYDLLCSWPLTSSSIPTSELLMGLQTSRRRGTHCIQ